MRLIDADKLIALCNTMADKRDGIGKSIWEQFATTVEWSPTVDAEPVKHGHWDDMGDFEQCSVCHGTHLKEYQTCYGKCLWVKMDYCPHCGAKMDDTTQNSVGNALDALDEVTEDAEIN